MSCFGRGWANIVGKMREVEPQAVSAWAKLDGHSGSPRRGLVQQAVLAGAYGCAQALLGDGVPTLSKLGQDGEWIGETNLFVALRALVVKEAKRRAGSAGPEQAFDAISRAMRDELVAQGKDISEAKRLVEKAAWMGSKHLGAAHSKSAWERMLLRQALALSSGLAGEAPEPARAG